MIVSCPACATRFTIPDTALGGGGKKVRCSMCGHTWKQTPPPPEAAARPGKPAAARKPKAKAKAKSAATATATAAVDETTRDIHNAQPPPAPPPPPPPAPTADLGAPHFPGFGADDGGLFGDLEHRHELGQGDSGEENEDWEDGDRNPTRWRRILGSLRASGRWLGFAAAVAGLLSFLVAGRDAIVNLWPAASRLYQTVGLTVEPPGAGLQFQAVKSEQRIDDGTVVLTVEGQILNSSDIDRDVPPVRATSYGPDHHMVRSWNIPVTISHLAPGAIATFRSVERDPGVISEVGVGF